jgi:predicted transcriptional regulator
MDIQFTDREIDVMEVLWERGPSLVSEVRAALKDDLAYTTVLTILRTLEGKRYVGH